MNTIKSLFACITLFTLPLLTKSQTDTLSLIRTQEELYSGNLEIHIDGEGGDYGELMSDVFEVPTQSIDINYVQPEIAFDILQLSEYQYYQLKSYIGNYGVLLTKYELLAIEGFSMEDLKRLDPYLKIVPSQKKKFTLKDAFRYGKHELLLRYEQVLEKKVGYDKSRSNHYLGSPYRMVFRYKFTDNRHLSFGIAGEKDAGEEFFKGSQKQGFDHYSFHLQLKNLGLLQSLTIGDYRIDLGQGLLLGTGLGVGKGSGAKMLRKLSTGIRPSTAMNESDYLTGAAVVIGAVNYKATLFYGHRFYDGTISGEEEETDLFFEGSLSQGAFHRTPNEIDKKHALMSHLYGFDFQYQGSLLRISIRGMGNEFSRNILSSGKPYQLFDFVGKRFFSASIDYQLLLKKTILFGEFVLPDNLGFAFLQGAAFEFDPRLKVSILFRYYDPKYHALYSRAFGENGKNKNEIGYYIAADLLLGRKVEVKLYYDLYSFPWLSYRVDKPVYGMDAGIRMTLFLRRNVQWKIQYRYKKQEMNSSEHAYYNTIEPQHKHTVMSYLYCLPFSFLELKTGIGFRHNSSLTEKGKMGLLLFQDINFSFTSFPMSIRFRLAFFDTDSYEERLYAYENDLLYSFTIYGHYYRGNRFYLMLKYRYRFIDFWLRISQTVYHNKAQISSGLEQINGNRKTEIKAQCLFRF